MSKFKAFPPLSGFVLAITLYSLYNCYMALAFLVSFWHLSFGNRSNFPNLGMVCTHLGGLHTLVLSITNALCLQDSTPDALSRPAPGPIRKPGCCGWLKGCQAWLRPKQHGSSPALCRSVGKMEGKSWCQNRISTWYS